MKFLQIPKKIFKKTLFFLIILFSISFIGLVVVFINFEIKANRYNFSLFHKLAERNLVYDKDEKLLGHLSGHGENRIIISSDEVSPFFINALLAREDKRFYNHRGVDYKGFLRALIINIKSKSIEQGASTITMQLVRDIFGMKSKTINRKLMEMVLARKLEKKFTKDQIITSYINRIYFGSGLYGIERASQGYFMKSAKNLTLSQSAILAGIIRGPSLLNPFNNINGSISVRDEVLSRMLSENFIKVEEFNEAKKEKINLRPVNKRVASGSYPLQVVYSLLNKFIKDPNDIKLGSLRIYTTIDSKLQDTAKKSLFNHLSKIEKTKGYKHPIYKNHIKGNNTNYLQGAVVSIDNSSGAIRAIVGGRDFSHGSYNRAYKSKRPVGSIFKPLVYAVAMDRGNLFPGVLVDDGPIKVFQENGPDWSPKNSDNKYTGLQPAALGVIRSRNTMSVRIGMIAGIKNVIELSKALKINNIPNSPVIYLGAFDASVMTMTSAYSILASGGINYSPFLIKKITDRSGRVIFENKVIKRRVFPPSVTWLTSQALSEVMKKGTGKSLNYKKYLSFPYGKTGTTNDYNDGWFLGYTDKISTGVWVGFDKPKKIFNHAYGSKLSLPIWLQIMKQAENSSYKSKLIEPPKGSSRVKVCRECGLIANNRSIYVFEMTMPPDLNPNRFCKGHSKPDLFRNYVKNRHPIAFPIPNSQNVQFSYNVNDKKGSNKQTKPISIIRAIYNIFAK